MLTTARAEKSVAKMLCFDPPASTSHTREKTSAQVAGNNVNLADSGIGVIIITHNVAQGLKVADKVTVLRLGRVAGVVDAKSTSEGELISMIVGANLAE
jgi:D-xylose transport system ATP-binding protein